ncbi:hypothetical protein VKT23_001172 [Stygiomarasmius scandens]|uniref:Uncharacterized protein n=1 Tax=Marasmiellus scandens TaxID=2682957 RepID=A0ABR1K6N9_9AGAR
MTDMFTEGSPTSDSFSFAPSHVSQSSVSSVQTLSAPSPPSDPDPSTPTAFSATSPPDITFHSPEASSSLPGLKPRKMSTPSLPSSSVSVATSPSSSVSPRPLPSVDRSSSVPQAAPPVRPPRARPPPVSKSQSSPSVQSLSSLSNPSSTPRTITTSTQPNSFDSLTASKSGTHLSPGVNPVIRPLPPISAADSRSRSGSKSSRSPSHSPAASPHPQDTSLSPVSTPTSSPTKKTSASSSSSITTTRGRSKSTVNPGGAVAATTARLATSGATANTGNGRMTDPKRSISKVGKQDEDKKKDEQDRNVKDSRDEEKQKSRDRASSSATLKSARPSSSKAVAGVNSGRNASASATTSDKSAYMPSSSTLESSATIQTPRSPPSARTALPDASSQSVNQSFKSSSSTTPALLPSTPIPSTTSPSGTHSNSPPRSHPRSHGHAHVNGPPSPGMGVSIKQLLSKPAPPGYTSAGSASESEGYASRGSKSFYDKDRERKLMREDVMVGTSQKTNLSGIEKDKERRREWEAERRLLREKSIERTRAGARDRSDSGAVTSGDEGPSTRERIFGGLMRSASLTKLREQYDKDDKGKEKEKRPRNVLRRKASGTLVNSAGGRSGRSSPPKEDQTSLPHQRQNRTYAAYAPPMLPLSPTAPKSPHSPPAPQMMQSTSGTLTLRPPSGTRGSSPSGPRARSSERSKDKSHSLGDVKGDSSEAMTPAKEIMVRYKQQQAAETAIREKMERKEREAEERNKEELKKSDAAEMRHDNLRVTQASTGTQGSTHVTTQLNIHNFQSVDTLPSESDFKHAKTEDEESAAMPYYTVYGSTSERVVAMGKPEDSSYGHSRKRSLSQPTSRPPASPVAPNTPPLRQSPVKSPVPDFAWDSKEGLDLSLSFGNESTGSGIHGGMGLDSPPEGGVKLNEVWERKVNITSKQDVKEEDKSAKPTRTTSFGGFGPKTLTRKMSAKWGRKGGLDSFGSVTRDSIDTGTVESVPVYAGAYGGIAEIQEAPSRPSLQERRASIGLGDDKSHGVRSLRLSIDKRAENPDTASGSVQTDSPEPLQKMHNPINPPTSALPTPPLSALYPSASPQLSPAMSSTQAAPTSKSKLWKLMKRISTGGLRDRYHYPPDSASSSSPSPASPFCQSPGETPPPVPAIPRDLAAYRANSGPARSSLSTIATASVSPVASGRQSRASSAHTNTSASSSKNPAPGTPGGIRMPPPLPPLSSLPRPGTGGTRSSSPISSSDKGSSKFFNKPQSRRSSSSSYGEELAPPPLPTSNTNSSSGSLGTSGSGGSKSAVLQQHIIPPSELYKLQLSLENENASSFSMGQSSSSTAHTPKSSMGGKSKRGDDYMIVRSPAEERPSFSLPVPRARNRDRERDIEDSGIRRPPPSEDGRPPSPIIPTFSTEGAINTWNKPKGKGERGRSQVSLMSTSVDAFSSGRRSMSIPGAQIPSSPTSPPPLPFRSSHRPSTANSNPPSAGSSRLTSPTRFTRMSPERAQSNEDIFSTISKVPPSPSHLTRKSIGVIPPSPSRPDFSAEFGQSSTRTPSTPLSRVTSPSSSTPRSASTSAAPWDSSSIAHSLDTSSILSSSSTPSKKGWGFHKGWKPSLNDKEKAAKWDDLLQRSEKAGGTLHLHSGSGLLSDHYPSNDD